MIRRERQFNEMAGLFANLSRYIDIKSMSNLYDANKAMEHSLIPILNNLFGGNFINLNSISKGYPAIDLGCTETRVAIQISSSVDSNKIRHTEKLFCDHGLFEQYDKLIFVDISTYKIKTRLEYKVINISDIVKMIGDLPSEKFNEMFMFVTNEFGQYFQKYNNEYNRNLQLNHEKSYGLNDNISEFIDFNRDLIEAGCREEEIFKYLSDMKDKLSLLSDDQRLVVFTILNYGESEGTGYKLGLDSLIHYVNCNIKLESTTDALDGMGWTWTNREERFIWLSYCPHSHELSDFDYFCAIKEYFCYCNNRDFLKSFILNCDFRLIK